MSNSQMGEVFNHTYKNKTVLVTGHTGFKGSWLALWLEKLGAQVVGYALDPITDRDNYVLTGLSERITDIRGDIRNAAKLEAVFEKYQPEYVFHLAAQPIVSIGYEKPVETYEINVMGSINVLECIRKCKKTKIGIFITTDKCYDNKEQFWGYRENDALGGYDPYSSSKGAAEIAIHSWQCSFMNPKDVSHHGKAIATVRAGNVIGGGDWSPNRIIPDCIRALEKDEPIQIRNPLAIRPWQHVLEPLSGYLQLGQKMTEDLSYYSESWNFGPYIQSIIPVSQVVEMIIKAYGKGKAVMPNDSSKVMHEASLLNLDISKAVFKLGWQPRLSIKEAIDYTVEWYKHYKEANLYKLCEHQIEKFSQINGNEQRYRR